MVCFDVLNELAAQALAEADQVTKNTFVDFKRAGEQGRRQSCSYGLLSLRRLTWDEEDISVKMCAAPERRTSVRRSTWDMEDIAALMRPAQAVRRPFVREETRAHTMPRPRVMVVKGAQKPTTCPGAPQRHQVSGMLQAPRPAAMAAPMCFTPFMQESKPWERTASPAPSMASTYAPSSSRCSSPCPSMYSMSSDYGSMSPRPSFVESVHAPVETKKKTRRGNTKKPTPPAKANEVTLMVRFLPYHYTPAALLQDVQAFLPNIDLFYLPTNFETKQNLGFAFFNFDDKAAAERFEEFWKASGISEKVESVESVIQASRVQGFAANVERIRNSSVNKELPAYLKPIIFKHGVPQATPW